MQTREVGERDRETMYVTIKEPKRLWDSVCYKGTERQRDYVCYD